MRCGLAGTPRYQFSAELNGRREFQMKVKVLSFVQFACLFFLVISSVLDTVWKTKVLANKCSKAKIIEPLHAVKTNWKHYLVTENMRDHNARTAFATLENIPSFCSEWILTKLRQPVLKDQHTERKRRKSLTFKSCPRKLTKRGQNIERTAKLGCG